MTIPWLMDNIFVKYPDLTCMSYSMDTEISYQYKGHISKISYQIKGHISKIIMHPLA